jgi:hypothetical protein
VNAEAAARLLRERAESYSRDGSKLRRGEPAHLAAAVTYETIARELRSVASHLDGSPEPHMGDDEVGRCGHDINHPEGNVRCPQMRPCPHHDHSHMTRDIKPPGECPACDARTVPSDIFPSGIAACPCERTRADR